MDIIEFREFCLSLPNTEEGMPFGDDTLVFKVGGKMFALTSIDLFSWINLKCDPDRAIELRERYEAIREGFHMNKRHWNTVNMCADLPDEFIKEMIRHSYDLVLRSLPRAKRE